MIKIWQPLLFSLLLSSQLSFAVVEVKDGTGQHVSLPAPAQRVVSLAPHITENLFAIGGGAQVVGVTRHSDYPEAAQQLPLVGDYEHLNLEAILALKPDLVIAWEQGTRARQLARLEALGVPVYRTDPNTFTALAHDLTQFGALLGHQEIARNQVEKLNSRLSEIKAHYQGRPPVRAFYQLWPEPMMTVNDSILLGRMMKLCGAQNIFADRPESVPRIGIEAVVARAPEVIITTNEVAADLQRWQAWPDMPAVANGQLCTLQADTVHRMTLRTMDGLSAMCACVEQARQSKDK